MMIGANPIGNYSPYSNKVENVKQSAKAAETKETKKTDLISNDEKKFFTKMYPENKNEIIDYHYYKSTGKMSGVSVGSLFDKRG